ncbi:MAG: SspB family protein [Stellaceae bacterium]
MMERAVRGVVREALAVAASRGLPGAHHFYITFKTRAPGVTIPDHLLGKYPEEMTIVLEHQFWDLEVTEETFAVTLSFNNKPARLTIPFAAISTFADPSVQFGLQFKQGEAGALAAAPQAAGPAADPAKPKAKAAGGTPGEVVTLDSFRKK